MRYCTQGQTPDAAGGITHNLYKISGRLLSASEPGNLSLFSAHACSHCIQNLLNFFSAYVIDKSNALQRAMNETFQHTVFQHILGRFCTKCTRMEYRERWLKLDRYCQLSTRHSTEGIRCEILKTVLCPSVRKETFVKWLGTFPE
jgi:hypothetical protein